MAMWSTTSRQVGPGSWLEKALARFKHQPGEFDCAVRVISGTVVGETERWKYRRSALDRLVVQDSAAAMPVLTLSHGPDIRLRVVFTGEHFDGRPPVRQFHAIWPAIVVDTQARIEIAADAGMAEQFRIPVR